MIFSTILFLFRFLPITLALYYLAPPKLKNLALFLCSLVFYSWGEVKFFPVMVVLILINYICGLLLEKFDGNVKARQVLLVVSIVGSLSMLVFFKYTNFLIGTVNDLFGLSIGLIEAATVLPLGISFYTFQTMSYSIDVYRRDVPAEHNIIDFGAYVVMFPQLIARFPGKIWPSWVWPHSCMCIKTAIVLPRSRTVSACLCSVWPKKSCWQT